MPISPARVAAFEILLRVQREDAFASELLHSSQYQTLSSPDHRLATEMVMGVLRWGSALDEEVANRSSLRLSKLDPEVLTALRLAAYQLMFLDRIPARAVIHESVELVKRARKSSAVPFANALLRKLASGQPRVAAIDDSKTVSDLARSSAHPQWLVERWVQEFGIDTPRQICAYDQQVPETFLVTCDRSLAEKLQNHGIELAPGRLLASSYRVVRGDLAQIPSVLRGQIAIQDEGSQLVALLLGAGSHMLDCCAAPGGKTRVLAERNPSARVVAAELHPHRARLLRMLVTSPNVRVIVADARTLPITGGFDRVLVDVPCSGTGTLARNPEIKWRLKPEDLGDLQTKQIEILRSAMPQVAPAGRLVYSTCSLENEENEKVVEEVLSADKSFRLLDCRERLEELTREGELLWKSTDSLTRGAYLRTVPGVHPCDGFFAAILERV
ncbi:MAG TPA: transcription antitermination factor NusB [Terriglobales bacterium]|nr:transcription antitermination factor NusB [Terriglobales bacterium]